MGTGDTTMPPAVREAKHNRHLIIEKTEGVTGSEDELFAADDIEDNIDLNKEDEIKQCG